MAVTDREVKAGVMGENSVKSSDIQATTTNGVVALEDVVAAAPKR